MTFMIFVQVHLEPFLLSKVGMSAMKSFCKLVCMAKYSKVSRYGRRTFLRPFVLLKADQSKTC